MSSSGTWTTRLAEVRVKAALKIKVFVLEALLRPVRPPEMIRLGSYYGGWWIPAVDPDRGAAFCVGAGTDVTFDLELQRLGYRVYTVDPTPSAVAHVRDVAPQLTLLPVGVWTETGELAFARDERWTESWAITTPRAAGRGVVESFPVMSVADMIGSVGETEVAVLKLDIEGAEHEVLSSMIASGTRPHCLCVEFDDHRLRAVVASTRLLRAHGYDLLQIEGLNYIFALR